MDLTPFHDATIHAIDAGLNSGEPTLIAALPAMGKSTGIIKWAAEHEQPVTIFAPRRDMYDDYREWATDDGLTVFQLASFHHDCDTIREYTEEELDAETEEETADRERERDAALACYNRGRSGPEIHRSASKLNLNLPCQRDGPCRYMTRRNAQNRTGPFEEIGLDPYDVVLGHYTHALQAGSEWIVDRYVAIDEFPDDGLIQEFSAKSISKAADRYISAHSDFPAPAWKMLTDHEATPELRKAAADYLQRHTKELRDRSQRTFTVPDAHPDAPLLMYAELRAKKKDEKWELAKISSRKRVVIGPDDEQYMLGIPDFTGASGVVALDGTPTEAKWQLLLGEDLRTTYVRGDEWNHYLRDKLKLKLYQTTENPKPYMSTEGTYLTPEKDLVLLEWIRAREGRRPALITSKTALAEYESRLSDIGGSLSDLVGATGYYNALKGTNDFAQERLGVVIGSRHLGDGYLKKWAAFMDETTGRVMRDDGNASRGADLRYTGIGNELLRGMQDNETLQAVMRFGRDGVGATVYVHTGALPAWVNAEQLSMDIITWNRGKQTGRKWVVSSIKQLPEWRTAEWTTTELTECVKDQFPEANSKKTASLRSTVAYHLDRLHEHGLLHDRQRRPRGTHYWSNNGLDTAGDFGYVNEERGTRA